MSIEHLRHLITSSSNLVCLMGLSVSMECGCLNYRQEDGLYDLEQKYGLSPEEIFSTGFYYTRPRQFFEFYQNEILNRTGEPDACLKTLGRMEQDGLIKAIITRELFSLPKRAGCRNVIELHGSIYDNACPRCQKAYSLDYMREGRPVPLCRTCGVPIRPNVCLMGQLVDSTRIFEAAKVLEEADTLLILGSHFESVLVDTCLPYFKGRQIILINDREHLSDRNASYVLHQKPADVIPLFYEETEAAQPMKISC